MLRGTEERLQAILDTAVDAIITIDSCGTIESLNQAVCRLFGYNDNEMLGHNVRMLMPQPYFDEHDGYLANYLTTGVKKIIGIGREVVGRRKDGTTFPMDLAVSEFVLGGERLFTGILRDITDRKNAEEAETSLGRILEESLNEIYIFDVETLRFVQVNRGGRENLGYSMDELRLLTPVYIRPEHSAETFAELVQPLVSGDEQIVKFETFHRRKDGSHYYVEVHLQISRYLGKSVFVAIVVDTTDRKKSEAMLLKQQQELQALNEELEDRVRLRTSELEQAQEELVRKEKLATLGQLAGSVAHEIRNPLGIIKNATYFLESTDTRKDLDIEDAFGEINRALENSNRIVSELLDYARALTPRLKKFLPDEVIKRALITAAVPEYVEVEHTPITEPVLPLADADQIERILINLIQNAAQAMPAGGKVTVRCVKVSEKEIAIEVQDTGEGIAEENLDKVFEPLFSRKVKGVGLGLALSRRYATINHGTLSVTSVVGSGSTFRLTLPLAD